MEFNRVKWDESGYQLFLQYLQEQKDEKYREFHGKLIRDGANLLGVRTPILKQVAKEIAKGDFAGFLKISDRLYDKETSYYESVMVEGLVIGYLKTKQITNLEEVFSYMDSFSVKISNWAHCDLFCSGMKLIGKEREAFWPKVLTYVESKDEFIIRLGIVLLMDYYLEEEYIDTIFQICDRTQSDAYYVNMAIAWLISVAYVKFEEKTLDYLYHNQLSVFTYNKALQKIVESYRVSDDKKEFIKTLKIPK